MYFEEKVDPYNIGTLLTSSEYRAFQNRFPPGANEALDVKMEEIAEKLATESLAAATSGSKAQLEPRSAQKWAKRFKKDPS
ncbi:hypothetical protein G6F46_004384 [Rhizopus delemar]|uniref:Uncharacterized protein n=2 Tax=Rhizopus TaxID=4842 RepID=A0A9P6Z4S2_9FUNG|nr:hypothetical protein G6F36_014176 [Rhizopus arrhizus]KAG1455877.1 hypothetical protein G6F55_006818 [Rhizopus delemar]KAG1502539.1 hypothetical protein G6F54_002298 [Rhizopus delemar]KAG1509070.1 hypothetical protein G6F53_007721 [Rhizopus delemar]KAG1524679.1 hypothetical protein G6F52_003994 [Rhizopus delemar]